MQKVRCSDCGRIYDYDDDAFCPRCGAFNQPSKSVKINERGEVIRTGSQQGRGTSPTGDGKKRSVSRARSGRYGKAREGRHSPSALAGWIILLLVLLNFLRILLKL